MKKIFGILITIGLLLLGINTFAQNNLDSLAKSAAAAGADGTADAISTNDTRGITLNEDCMLNGQCGFNIYEFLGIRQDISDNNSPELYVQDILLSATFFIGTIVTLAFIISGVMFIFAGATGKDPTKAKAGIKNSIIGLLIVICSYSIIRVVQYIAKGI